MKSVYYLIKDDFFLRSELHSFFFVEQWNLMKETVMFHNIFLHINYSHHIWFEHDNLTQSNYIYYTFFYT